MNAITTRPPASPQLVPANLREAMDLANVMCRAKLLPKDLQNSPGDTLLVIEQAARWQMSPFAVAQEVSVIQGKLMYSGKIVAAAVQSSGVLRSRLQYAYDGEGDERRITVTGHLNGEQQPRSVVVKLRDAKTNNQMWTKQADQQLAYHGVRVWARRYVPEVMLGVYAPEEMQQHAADSFAGTTIDGTAEPAVPQPPAQQGQPRETERVLGGDGLPDDLAGHAPEPPPQKLLDDAASMLKAAERASTEEHVNWLFPRSGPVIAALLRHGRADLAEQIDATIKLADKRVKDAARQAPPPAEQGGADPFDLARKEPA